MTVCKTQTILYYGNGQELSVGGTNTFASVFNLLSFQRTVRKIEVLMVFFVKEQPQYGCHLLTCSSEMRMTFCDTTHVTFSVSGGVVRDP